MKPLRNRLFLAVALGHMMTDIFNSAGPVLIVFLSVPLGLTNAQVGLAASLYALGGSVGQPLFGWLGDRFGNRWLSGVGVAWVAGFMALTTIVARRGTFAWVLVPYALAAFGSAAFHPTGVASAADSVLRRAATATAVFFLFGQIGLATGPVLAGFLLERIGLLGVQLLALVAIPVVALVLTAPHAAGQHGHSHPPATGEMAVEQRGRIAWGAIVVLAVLAAARSWAQLGTVNFLPKLFQEKGWDPTAYGAITGTMWFASAILGVLAGQAADRWGRRQVLFGAMFAAVLPLYLLPLTNNWLAFPLALLAGGLTGAPHSIIVVIVQALLPGRKAMASGIALGFIFAMGAVANLGIGWLADLWTLPVAMQLGAGMALLSAVLALVLPPTRKGVAHAET